jgi:hypothetical protein
LIHVSYFPPKNETGASSKINPAPPTWDGDAKGAVRWRCPGAGNMNFISCIPPIFFSNSVDESNQIMSAGNQTCSIFFLIHPAWILLIADTQGGSRIPPSNERFGWTV